MKVLFVVLLLAACGREERRPSPDVVERTRTRIEAKDVALDDVAPEVVEEASVVTVDDVAQTETTEVATVSREACEAACQNALRVTLAELPAGTAPAMEREIDKALREKCPSQCVDKGSVESVTCVAHAKTGLELAACPR